ncbi:MAG: hypothetical protein DRG69_02850 [Deltaproteobacteria bacterium]|nr:MAG: hypothetical protein DRG69_02850 [Deltaproteobacteria bacterium]
MMEKEILKKAYTMSQAGLIAYVMAVGEKIGWDEALRILAKLHAGMQEWAKNKMKKLSMGDDARAASVLLESLMEEYYPGFQELMEIKKVIDTPEKVVFHYKGWCATLEACKMLGIAPKEFCPVIHEEGLTPIIQTINPNLQVRLGKIRPNEEYCELIIERSVEVEG